MYFWPVESKSDVHFCRPEPETLDNLEKTKVSGLSGGGGGVSVATDENGYRI